MFNNSFVIDKILSNKFDELRKLNSEGQLKSIRWSAVLSKVKSRYSTVELYKLINGLNCTPKCITCNTKEVTQFLSFSKGFNLYCSKSCAKLDPNVEAKKQITLLNKNSNWKETAELKRQSTNLLKYGKAHPLQVSEVREKRKNTNIKKHGAEEVLSTNSAVRQTITLDIAKNKLFSRLTSFDTVTPLFSKDAIVNAKSLYSWQCNVCKCVFTDHLFCGNIPKCQKCFPRSSSTGEKELYDYIATLLPNEEIKQRFKINSTEIDVYIPNLKTGIEFNGIYWHSEKMGTPKYYHKNKKDFCHNLDIKLLQFWDYQWIHKKEIVKSIISTFLQKNSKIYARKCSIREISEKESSTFLNDNHLSGNAKGSFLRLGMYYGDDLVFVSTFCKPRFTKDKKDNTIELLRMCSKKFTSVIGAAEKCLTYFLSKNDNNIVSFCDEMAFHGTVYQKIGFTKVDHGKPSCWYFSSNGKLIHRSSFQKKKLLSMLNLTSSSKTEWELAQDLKLNRVWDCGNSKWFLKNEIYCKINSN